MILVRAIPTPTVGHRMKDPPVRTPPAAFQPRIRADSDVRGAGFDDTRMEDLAEATRRAEGHPLGVGRALPACWPTMRALLAGHRRTWHRLSRASAAAPSVGGRLARRPSPGPVASTRLGFDVGAFVPIGG